MTEEVRFREVNELFQLVIPRFDSFNERTDDCDYCPFFEEECSGDGAERCLAEDVLMLLNMGAEYQKQLDQVTRERDAAESNKFQYETGFVKGFEAAQPKWISVKERLPERAMKCLVRSKVGRTFTTWYAPEIYRFVPHFAKSNVTHWMPLPEPPKEG